MFEDEVITTMHLFKALTHSKYEMRSCCDGHGGFAVRIFGIAVRSSLLHWSRRDLVSRFQPVSSSATTPVLRPSCIERQLKIAGEYTSVRSTAHMSKQVFTRPCTDSLPSIPGNAFDVNTRLVNFSESLALLSLMQSVPIVPACQLGSNTRTSKNICLCHVLEPHAKRSADVLRPAAVTVRGR